MRLGFHEVAMCGLILVAALYVIKVVLCFAN